MRRFTGLGILTALAGAALLGPTSVGALDYTDRPIEVSLDQMTDEESFPPAASDATLVSNHPEDCKLLPTCDTLSLVLKVPANFIYRLGITTFFEHANPSGVIGANDLDIFYWQGTLVKGAWEWKQIGSSASAGQPEKGKFGDLPPTTETNSYAIVVSTFTGSSPYTVKAEITIPKTKYGGPAQQTTQRPRQISDPETTGAKPTASKPFSPSALPLEELETVEPVKVPGADGPLVEHELATAKAEAEADEKTNRTPLIVSVIALIVVGGGLFAFFFLRSRRATATV